MRKCLGFVTGLGMLLTATTVFAQQPAPGEPPPPPPPPVTTTPPPEPPPKPVATVTATTTTPVVATIEKKDDGITDHEKVVGKLGVMYFGVTEQPIGIGPGTVGPNAGNQVARGNVQTPIIGVRYWLRERLGLDLGVGLNFFSSSTAVTTNNVEVSTDGPAVMAFALHGGVPLAFAYGKHYKFLLVPELNVGYATQTAAAQNVPPGTPAPADLHLSGFRLDVGARVGTEIQFGFIGVPELALQASVGLNLRRRSWSASQDGSPAGTASEASDGQTDFGTTVQSDPWALFVNNISAIYYFP